MLIMHHGWNSEESGGVGDGKKREVSRRMLEPKEKKGNRGKQWNDMMERGEGKSLATARIQRF